MRVRDESYHPICGDAIILILIFDNDSRVKLISSHQLLFAFGPQGYINYKLAVVTHRKSNDEKSIASNQNIKVLFNKFDILYFL